MSRRRAVIIAVIVVAVLVTNGLTWWIASRAHTPEQQAAEAGAPPPSQIEVTATSDPVERTVLADCRAEARHTVTPQLGAVSGDGERAVTTGTPRKAGDRVENGTLLAEVSSRPIIALTGTIPAFRTMRIGTRGPDVSQLHAALRKAGRYSGASDKPYSLATATAVASLYNDLGYPAPGGDAEAKSAAEDARRDLAGFSGKRSGAEYARLVAARDRTAQAAAATVPLGEVVFVPELPARVTNMSLSLGQAPGDAQLKLASGTKVEKCTIAGGLVSQVRKGQTVHIESASAPGRVEEIQAPSATSGEQPKESDEGGSADESQPTGDAGDDHADSGDASSDDPGDEAKADATVIVSTPRGGQPVAGPGRIVVESGPRDALAVPASAVHTAPDGSTHVTRVREGATAEAAVDVVFSADGMCAVRGKDLSEGDSVVIRGRAD